MLSNQAHCRGRGCLGREMGAGLNGQWGWEGEGKAGSAILGQWGTLCLNIFVHSSGTSSSLLGLADMSSGTTRLLKCGARCTGAQVQGRAKSGTAESQTPHLQLLSGHQLSQSS